VYQSVVETVSVVVETVSVVVETVSVVLDLGVMIDADMWEHVTCSVRHQLRRDVTAQLGTWHLALDGIV